MSIKELVWITVVVVQYDGLVANALQTLSTILHVCALFAVTLKSAELSTLKLHEVRMESCTCKK